MEVFVFTFALLAFLAVAWTENSVEECPVVDGENATLLKNPTDCSTFIKCESGSPTVMNCSTGLEWNDEKKTCDWPNDANCIEESE